MTGHIDDGHGGRVTNPTTAEKVSEALKNYFTGPGAATACHEYAQDIENHISHITAELASLQRERDAALHEISCCDDVNLGVPLAQSINELQQHRERAERERDGFKQDAERYRWLCEIWGRQIQVVGTEDCRFGISTPTWRGPYESLDAAIDTARGAGNGRSE